jgi:hypothetical protein
MVLRGMGFTKNTPIYLAAGKIYEAEKNMAPLRQMFPYLHTKETLLSAEEVEPLKVSDGFCLFAKFYATMPMSSVSL